MYLKPYTEPECRSLISSQVIKPKLGQGITLPVTQVSHHTPFQYHAMPLDNYSQPSGVLKQQALRKRYGSPLVVRWK